VEALVNLESTSSRVPLVAPWKVANVGFVPRVGQLVGLQVALSDKCLIAAATGEGPLSGLLEC